MHPIPNHNSGIVALEAPHHHRHAALSHHALQCATVNRDFGDNITFSTSLDIPTGGIAVISMVNQSRLFKLGLQHAASLRFINEQVYPPTKPLPPRAVPLAAAAPSCALSCCLPASLTPPPQFLLHSHRSYPSFSKTKTISHVVLRDCIEEMAAHPQQVARHIFDSHHRLAVKAPALRGFYLPFENSETMEEVTLIGQVLCADLLEPSRPATQDNVWLPTCFTIYHPNNLTYEPLFTIAGTCMATCHNPCAHSLGVHAC